MQSTDHLMDKLAMKINGNKNIGSQPILQKIELTRQEHAES